MDPRFREDDEAGSGKQKARFWRALGSSGSVLAVRPGYARSIAGHGRQGSVAKHFLLELAALLRLEGQAGRWPGDQPSDANGFTGFIAVTVVTGINAGNRLLNFLEQLALAVAGAQLKSVFFFDGRAVGRVRHDDGVFAQVLGGCTGAGMDFLLEQGQLVAEKSQLRVIHVFAVRHGFDFFVRQGTGFFGLPVVGQFGVFFGRDMRRGRDHRQGNG